MSAAFSLTAADLSNALKKIDLTDELKEQASEFQTQIEAQFELGDIDGTARFEPRLMHEITLTLNSNSHSLLAENLEGVFPDLKDIFDD